MMYISTSKMMSSMIAQLTWKTLVAGWICLPPPGLLLREPPIKDTS